MTGKLLVEFTVFETLFCFIRFNGVKTFKTQLFKLGFNSDQLKIY